MKMVEQRQAKGFKRERGREYKNRERGNTLRHGFEVFW